MLIAKMKFLKESVQLIHGAEVFEQLKYWVNCLFQKPHRLTLWVYTNLLFHIGCQRPSEKEKKLKVYLLSTSMKESVLASKENIRTTTLSR